MTWAAFVRSAYQAARRWEMQPSEFWDLSPGEWWAEFDARVRDSREMARLAKGGPGAAFSEAEWADARRRHAERPRNGDG